MYAIVEDGGKQYRVTSGDVLRIEHSSCDATTFTFERVLLIGGEGEPKIGQPFVAGATVSADVLGVVKDKKIDTIKYRRRKGYHKKIGHRQSRLSVRITGINVG